MRGEITPVVVVERLGDAAHRPVRFALAPDRLAEGEGSLNRGRCMQTQGITSHGAAVVVEHGRQPRLSRLTPLVEYPEVERGVVGLPHLVWPARLAAVQQLKPVG